MLQTLRIRGMVAAVGAASLFLFLSGNARADGWLYSDCQVSDLQTVKINGQRAQFIFYACGYFWYIPWDENYKVGIALVEAAQLSAKHINIAEGANGNGTPYFLANCWLGDSQTYQAIWAADNIQLRD